MLTEPSSAFPEPTDDPKAVSQYMLDRTGHALMTGDLALYLSCFILPHRVQTFEGAIHITDTATLTRIFNDVRQTYASAGVTALERRCSHARFAGPHRVDAHYESRALRGTQLIYRPFPALTAIHFDVGGWRVGDCQYAIAEAPRLVQALLGRRP